VRRARGVIARLLLFGLSALVLAGGAVALGFWQLGRAESKARTLAQWEAARGLAPRPLAEVLDAGFDDDAPVPVFAHGQYDTTASVLLDNQIHAGRAGVMAYTRFQPDGSARSVLVNRGWLPMPADRSLPVVPLPPGEPAAISGLLVAPPAAGLELENPPFQRGSRPALLLWLDLETLRSAIDPGLADRVLLLDPAVPLGFERSWKPLPNTLPPEKHHGYAVQWFGIAAAILTAFSVLAWRSRAR
jgi:cytochrome oxidase assembly protein ShyY1